MTSLTNWLLRAFADGWPGGLPEDGDQWGPLYLENRDESAIVEHDTSADPTTLTRRYPSTQHDLTTGGTLGVALTDYAETPAGLGGLEYATDPVLSVRVVAAPARKHGTVEDAADFEAMVRQAIEVVEEIDNGTLQAAPVADFHVADPGLQTPELSDWKDRYSWTLEVEPSGYKTV